LDHEKDNENEDPMNKRFQMFLLVIIGILLVGSSSFAGVFAKEEYAARRVRLKRRKNANSSFQS